MMLICDVCTFAYAIYPQHEKVSNAYATNFGNENFKFKPNICYTCARKIVPIASAIFPKPIPEE
jgi:hypothetical protein